MNSNPNPIIEFITRQIPHHQKHSMTIWKLAFAKSPLQKQSKTVSKSVFANFPHHLKGKILKQFKKLSQPQILLYRANLLTLDLPIEWFYWLSPRNCKNTWPSGYKYPVHNHNIHSLATIHLLNSTRRNSSRPAPQFLNYFTWIVLSNAERTKYQHSRSTNDDLINTNFSKSAQIQWMKLSVSLSFHFLAE